MAIYHMHVKVISRTKSAGRTAPAAAAYRAGEKIQERATGITHDYTRKGGIVHSEILLPAGAPERLRDRATLWNDAEAAEKRVNSRVAREVEIALPAELSRAEQVELVREYARLFVRDGMCADVSIHDKNDGNPHAHMLLTTREIDAKSGEIGQKRRDWNDREKLESWREAWATLTNAALERAGIDARIDHRTLDAQGIERRPTIHTGRDPEKLKANAEIKEDNARIEEINAQLEELKAEREAEAKRPRTHQEQIAALDKRIEEIGKQIDANKRRIDELTERREQGAKDLPSTDIELKEAQARAEEKKQAYQDIYDDAEERLNKFFYGGEDVARKGIINSIKKSLGFEYYVDVEATSEAIEEAKKEQGDAKKKIDEIDKDLEKEEAAIMRKARARYDDLHKQESEERAKLEQENCELGPERLRCVHERNTLDNRIKRLDKIRDDLAIVDRGSPIGTKERSEELEAANNLRKIRMMAEKSEPRDDEILKMLQPQAEQIKKLTAEYDEQRKKARRRDDFERD